MSSSKLFQLGLAFGLGLILLVVSCAPAAEPTAAPTAPPPTPTAAPATPTPAPTLAPGVTPTATLTSAPVTIATPRPPTPTPTPAAVQPRRGGTLVMSGNAFGFASWEECCSTFAKMVNDSVLEYIPANNKLGGDEEVRGRMATEWSVSKDGLSWAFKLEPNMKAAIPENAGGGFEVVDCADVAWAIMKMKTGEGLRRTMRGRTFVPVTKVECPDPLTAVVHTKWPYAGLAGMLAVSINDVKPSGYWDTRLKDLPATLVGSGPWKLQQFIAGEIITLVPNPYYHRKAPDGKPYPYMAKINMLDIPYQACAAGLRTGRIHMCGEGFLTHSTGGNTLYKEATQLQFLGPFRLEDNPEWGSLGFLGTNPIFYMAHHEKAPWNNVKLRRALSLSLDRRTLCDIAIEKWCQPGGWVFQPGSAWNLPRNVVENYPDYNINTAKENTARARQILTELGYSLYPDPKALTIDGPTWPFTGDFVQAPVTQMMREAGFNPNIYMPELQRVLAQVVSGEFEMVGWDQLVSHGDPNQICYEHYFTGSDRNYGRYSSPKADDLCNRLGQELDRTKRIAQSQEFHKLILDDHARATFLWRGFSSALSPDVRGYESSSWFGGGSNGRAEKWWLAK